jgi:hypothetical protein
MTWQILCFPLCNLWMPRRWADSFCLTHTVMRQQNTAAKLGYQFRTRAAEMTRGVQEGLLGWCQRQIWFEILSGNMPEKRKKYELEKLLWKLDQILLRAETWSNLWTLNFYVNLIGKFWWLKCWAWPHIQSHKGLFPKIVFSSQWHFSNIQVSALNSM